MRVIPGKTANQVILDDEESFALSKAACTNPKVRQYFTPELEYRPIAREALMAALTARAICQTCPVTDLCQDVTIASKATGIAGGQYYVQGKRQVIHGLKAYEDELEREERAHERRMRARSTPRSRRRRRAA